MNPGRIRAYISNIRPHSEAFLEIINSSKFQYSKNFYEKYFSALSEALDYIEKLEEYSSSDETLIKHIDFIKNLAVKEDDGTVVTIENQLLTESENNLPPKGSPNETEQTEAWCTEIHAAKNTLQGMSGWMGCLRSSLAIAFREGKGDSYTR